MESLLRPVRRFGVAPALLLLTGLLLAGCGSSNLTSNLEPGFTPRANPLVAIGAITNVSPPFPEDEKVALDPLQELKTQLEAKLLENNMLAGSSGAGKNYVLVPEIKEYRPGSAFKRWLWPGYGSTILSVESVLQDGGDKVGEISTRRTIDAGGAYTAGAYQTIFSSVAEDIVADLKQKLSPGS
jgi:hypothetical protein